MERPFDEDDVAQRLEPARGDRIALRPAAMIGHQYERQVGPGRLVTDPQSQRLQIGIADRFLGNQHEGDIVGQGVHQPRQVVAHLGIDIGLTHQTRRHRCVAAARRQDERAQLR